MSTPPLSLAVLTLALTATACTVAATASRVAPGAWAHDRVWYSGKAEWALYDAVRPIYGTPRRYEATIFTNKQLMDPARTTKGTASTPGAFEVFKHNVSEMIETEHYTYRFITTSFVRTDDLTPYKVAFSSQEDCGTTYREFVATDDRVRANQFCYFPEGGEERAEYERPDGLTFHDTLSLVLRNGPFEPGASRTVALVPDQTDTHRTSLRPTEATITYVERDTITVPRGAIDAHHVRVTHASDGGVTTSDYWFAADPALRHVMVRYRGPYGVEYELKRYGFWAYWNRDEPRPE